MANKYLIDGATYCGDGTASNEAASAGAAGAWNDKVVIEGTAPAYGTLAAGDVVYIRSKNASGNDITRTLTAALSLGSSAATVSAPIYWILDNGTIWSGIDGVLKYQASTSSHSVTIRASNIFVAKTQDALQIVNTATNPGDWEYLLVNNGWLIGALLDWSAKTGSYGTMIRLNNGSVLERPHVRWGRLAPYEMLFSSQAQNGAAVVIAPDIELLNSTAYGQAIFGMTSNGYSMDYIVIGGQLRGPGSTAAGQSLVKISAWDNSHLFRFSGFSCPKEVAITSTAISYPRIRVEMIASDSKLGGHIEEIWGWATSRTDNNPPHLSGSLPDSTSSGWAVRVWPRAATGVNPMCLPTTKVFTETAAVKTITQNILSANTITTSKRTMWITVEYVDNATGLNKCISTRDAVGAALDASTANWSATVWGMVAFDKKQLSVTTPTAIKQDTPITVTVWCTQSYASANDIFFMDLDFSIT